MNTNTQHPASNAALSGTRAFLILSPLFLFLASAMLAARPGFLVQRELTGHGVAWLTLLILGCGLSGAFGLVYGALLSGFGTRRPPALTIWLHLLLHVTGILLSILGAVRPAWDRFGLGPILLSAGAIVFLLNVGRGFLRPQAPNVSEAFLLTSALWLVILAFAGVPFAASPPPGLPTGSMWGAGWLILALGGVLFNLPLGLALRTLPLLSHSKKRSSILMWSTLVLLNIGVAWSTAAATYRLPGFLMGCALIALLGALCALGAFVSVLPGRDQGRLSWSTRMLAASMAAAPLSFALLAYSAWHRLALAAAAAAAPETTTEPAAETATTLPLSFLPSDAAATLVGLFAVGIPAILAVALQLIRIQRSEQDPPPPLRERFLLAAYFNYATGVLLIIPSAWAGIEQPIALGSLFLVVSSLAFLGIFATRKSKTLESRLPA